MAENATPTRYTKVYEGTDAELGEIVVCIEGIHDLDNKNVVVLDHDLHVFRVVRGKARRLDDPEIEATFVSLVKSYFYMIDGVVVTSECQPTEENIEGSSTWRLDVPDYGVVIIEHCGIVGCGDDEYQISVSHPGPSVYLVILLEIIDANPLTFRAADIEDADLRNGIINCYLHGIGAIADPDTPSVGEN